jgi:hypothetical protein
MNADCESGVYAHMGALLRLRRGRMRTLYAAVFRTRRSRLMLNANADGESGV